MGVAVEAAAVSRKLDAQWPFENLPPRGGPNFSNTASCNATCPHRASPYYMATCHNVREGCFSPSEKLGLVGTALWGSERSWTLGESLDPLRAY